MKDNRSPSVNYEIAIHEAGHAIVTHSCGYALTKITIQPGVGEDGRQSEGAVSFRRARASKLANALIPARVMRRHDEHEVIISLAGLTAQAIYRTRCGLPIDVTALVPPSIGDVKDMKVSVMRSTSIQSRSEYLNRMQLRTEKLLCRRANWRAVIALADALVEQETLSGDEATEIIRHAMRRPRKQAA